MTREACLETRYASLYGCLRPEVWEPAAVVADRLLAWSLEHPGTAGLVRSGRVLDEQHFSFRGRSPRAERCCTRAGER